MKISQQEKSATRARILEAAVDVMTSRGFKSATMREIAQRAQVGDATIYSYFPSKEKLLYGYCAHVQEKVMEGLKAIDNFHDYALAEQLQQLVELELETWLPAREFLREAFKLTFYSPVAAYEHLQEARSLFTAMVTDLLEAAIEAGEIPQQPYRDLLPRLFWDYQTGVLAYWLKDDSEAFANTTQMVDQSMEIVASILQQGMVGKTLDLLSFIFRTHVMSRLETFRGMRRRIAAGKRRFMAGQDDAARP